jgi:5'-3' exonuclease
MEGKRNEWEGIAILPIINIEDIRKSYWSLVGYISDADRKRNIVGLDYIYVYDETIDYEIKNYYGNIKKCKVRITKK